MRPGYKLTEVGVIPEDWAISTVGHEFDVQLGKMLDAEKNVGEPKPYLGNRNVQWGQIDISELFTTRMTRADMERFRLRKGDLLVCEGGEVGRAAIWGNPVSECYYQKALHRLRPSQGFDPRLMVELLRQWSERGVLSNYVTQTSIAHLPREKFVEVPLPVPPVDEQRAIATALSDTDALLDGLNRLIAKKRNIRQAAMQQLLTGQTRLPGFSGEWEVKRLGDHLIFLKNGVNSRAELSDNGDVLYLHYGDIHGSPGLFLNLSKTLIPCLPSAKAGRLDRLKDGDLIFADASEDMEGVGKAVEIQGIKDIELVSGLHTIAVRFDKAVLADGFKSYLRFMPSFRGHLRRLAAGTKVYATNRAHIASAEVKLPRVNEQAAIAVLLSAMDFEITALETRLTKTRALKQAMMQELLTGRTRLVTPAGKQKANIHFIRSVLAAEIIDQLHEQPTFGHVKFEKMMFLVEYLCEVETGSTYLRKAAGPYDSRALRSIDSQLRTQQWFDARKEDGRYRYVPMKNRGGHKQYFDRYFPEIGDAFGKILATFKAADTERCEIVATLLAAWSDLLGEKGTVSDEMIVHEVLNNWHESKRRIPEDRWLKALAWMRDKGFVPKGARSHERS